MRVNESVKHRIMNSRRLAGTDLGTHGFIPCSPGRVPTEVLPGAIPTHKSIGVVGFPQFFRPRSQINSRLSLAKGNFSYAAAHFYAETWRAAVLSHGATWGYLGLRWPRFLNRLPGLHDAERGRERESDENGGWGGIYVRFPSKRSRQATSASKLTVVASLLSFTGSVSQCLSLFLIHP